MKKILSIVLIGLISTGLTTIILFDHFTGQFPWSISDTEEGRRTVIRSRVLNEDREVIVHLPRNYDSMVRYPVIYVLDGGAQDAHIFEKFEILSAAGCTPETIVVGIPNMTDENRQRDLVPPFMNIEAEDNNSPHGDGHEFLAFIETELIPFIESNYSTSKIRLFSGYSRGGLLVMYSLLHKSALFQARFCFSTPFWRQDNILVSKVDEFLSSKDTLSTFIYMSAGTNETKHIKAGLADMIKVFRDKAPVGFTSYADYTPGADHQNNSQISAARAIGAWSKYLRTPNHEGSPPDED